MEKFLLLFSKYTLHFFDEDTFQVPVQVHFYSNLLLIYILNIYNLDMYKKFDLSIQNKMIKNIIAPPPTVARQ